MKNEARMLEGTKQMTAKMLSRAVLATLGLSLSATGAGAQHVQYYHLDAIGNVRVVTDPNRNVVERHDYLPFGEECTTGPCSGNTAPGAGQPKKFTGKERDKETGLDYFGARYYGSRIARFTTVDPVLTIRANLVDPQRWNRYAYAKNNPLRFIDPDGRLTIIVPGTWARGVFVKSASTDWAQPGTPFNTAVSTTFGEQAQVFEWSGSNKTGARASAAEGLKQMIDAHTFEEGESLNIVAHSHGGNVVKAYSQLEGARDIDTLVNLGTPQRPDYKLKGGAARAYINGYSTSDDAQTSGGEWFAAGQAFRTDPSASNVDLTSVAPSHGSLHTEKAWHEVERSLPR
jgi:RHS repeat-associated protein